MATFLLKQKKNHRSNTSLLHKRKVSLEVIKIVNAEQCNKLISDFVGLSINFSGGFFFSRNL